MPRDFDRLSRTRYDLLIVGGGIHGLFAAYDAAQRGLSVALVERDDFGSGLSFNHQRTVHGGLRALETGDMGKVREQVAERRTWAVLTPHLIRPLPFLTGTYKFTAKSRWLVGAGMMAYNAIGRSRNVGLPPELRLPNAGVVSAQETLRLFPGIRRKGLTGGAMWHDYQATHPDRINWSVALAAIQAGAVLINYVEATGPLRESGRIAGARVRDCVTGAEADIEARVTLLCAGSGLEAAMNRFGVTGAPPLVRAMNVLIDRPGGGIGVASPGSSGRMLTAVPWRGSVLAGTHQSRDTVTVPEDGPSPAHVAEMLDEVNAAFPSLDVTPHDVRLVHYGLTPAVVRHGMAQLMPESTIIRHAVQGRASLLSVVGVKFTTARHTAELAVDAICNEIGRSDVRCDTAAAPLPYAVLPSTVGALAADLLRTRPGLAPDMALHLADWYGGEAGDVVHFALERGLIDRLDVASPVMSGEIAYAVLHGHALRLSDAVLRRTLLGSAGHPGRDALFRAAAIMAPLLSWTEVRMADEISAVERRYPNGLRSAK